MGTHRPYLPPKRPRRMLTLLTLLILSTIAIHAVHADPWAVPSWSKEAAASRSDNAEEDAASGTDMLEQTAESLRDRKRDRIRSKDIDIDAYFQAANSPAQVVDPATASSSLSSSSSTSTISGQSSRSVAVIASPSSTVTPSTTSTDSTTSSTATATASAGSGAGAIFPFLPGFFQPAADAVTSSSAGAVVPTQAVPTATAAAVAGVQKRDTDFMPTDWIEGDTRSGNPMAGPDVGTPNVVGETTPQAPIIAPQHQVPIVGQHSSSIALSTTSTASSSTTSVPDTTATTTATAINFNLIQPNIPVVTSASAAPIPLPTNPAGLSPIVPRRVSSDPVDLRPPGFLPGIDSGDDPASGPGAAFVPIQGAPAITAPAGGALTPTDAPVKTKFENTDMFAPGYVRGVDNIGGGNPAGGPEVGRPVIRAPRRDPRRRDSQEDRRDSDDDKQERETFEVVADVLRGIERELFGDSKFSVQQAGSVKVQEIEREHAVSADGRFDAVYDERDVEVVNKRDGRSARRRGGRRGRGRGRGRGRKRGDLRSIGKSLRQALSRAQKRGDFKGAEEARKYREELAKLAKAYQNDIKEARKNKNRPMARRVSKQFIARVRELQTKSRGLIRKYAGRGRQGKRRNNGVKSASDLKNMIAKLAVQVKREHKQVKDELKQQDKRLVELVNDLVQGRQARADQVRLAVMSLHEALRKVGLQLARYEAKHAAQDRRQLEKLNAFDYQLSSLREANKLGSEEDKARRQVEMAEIESQRSLLTAQRASRHAKLIEVRSRARAVQASVKAFVTDLRRRAKEGPGSNEVKASEEAIERIRNELQEATKRVRRTTLFSNPSKVAKKRASATAVKLTVALGPRGHKQLVSKVNAIIRDGRLVRRGLLKRGNAAGQIRVRVRLGQVIAETKLWYEASGKKLAAQREQAGKQSEVQVKKIKRQVKQLDRLHGKVQKRIQRAIKVAGKAIMPGEPVPDIARPNSRRERRAARRNAAKARRQAKRKVAKDKRDARRNAAKAKRGARQKARQARQQQRKQLRDARRKGK